MKSFIILGMATVMCVIAAGLGFLGLASTDPEVQAFGFIVTTIACVGLLIGVFAVSMIASDHAQTPPDLDDPPYF